MDAKGIFMSLAKYIKQIIGILVILIISVLIIFFSFALKWDKEATDAFSSGLWQLPSSVYARSLELFSGCPVGRVQLIDEMQRLGYTQDASLSRAGLYSTKDSTIEMVTREFAHWEGVEPSQRLSISFKDGLIEEIKNLSGEIVDIVRLEPPLIGHIYPSRKELRQLVKITEVPELLVKGLVAIEDRDFFTHHGVDPKGIARAMWLNVKAGRIVQGGSTLTQQLVKNLFLSSEQSLVRKFREVIMALLIERHFSKQEILEAYLNEVFFGQTSAGAIHGFGLASMHYFGAELNKITLPQMALLIAVINGPGSYTGLRVGLSAAKGICYALNIPLICINTLTWMAEAHLGEEATLVAPMIDARRDEVFTAIFDHKGNVISAPAALKLTENSFERELNNHAVSFVGDGAIKWKNTCKHPRAAFPPSTYNAHHLAKLALAYFTRNEFADVAYSEPFYVKDFYSTQKK